jgi:hypothetical protein
MDVYLKAAKPNGLDLDVSSLPPATIASEAESSSPASDIASPNPAVP